MEDEKNKKGNILVDAAKVIGSVAGKVASLTTPATPEEAPPQEAKPATTKKPTTPKSPKKMKLAAKNKSRLPRREKKELKKTQRRAASKG